MFKEVLGESFAALEKYAPSLASAVGSPAAGTATLFGLNLLAHAFGVPVNNLDGAIATDTAAPDRLTQLEQTFGTWFKANAGGNGAFPWPSSIEIKVSWDKGQTGLSRLDNPDSSP